MFGSKNLILFCIVLVCLTMLLGALTDAFRTPTAVPIVGPGMGNPAMNFGTSGLMGSTSQNPSVLPPVTPTVVDVEATRVAQVRQQLDHAGAQLTDALSKLDQASQSQMAWGQEIEPLMRTDSALSSFLADQDELVEQLTHLLDAKKPTQAEIQAVRDRAMVLALQSKSLSSELHPVLPPSLVPDTAAVQQDAQSVAQQWANTLAQGRAVVREAERRRAAAPSSTAPRSSSSLRAIASFLPVAYLEPNGSQLLALTDPPAQAEGASKKSKLDAAVQKKRDAAKLRELDEARKIQAEIAAAEAAEAAIDEEVARELAKEKAALVKEARSADVSLLLQPFFTPRNLQPRLAGASVQMRRTFEKKPMSLSALQSMGALDQSMRGLEVMVRIGAHRELDGPRWEYRPSPRTWSAETQEKLQTAQDMLRRLGPTLVEQRLLSK